MVKKCVDCKHHYYTNMVEDFRCIAPKMREVGWNNSELPTYSNSTIFQRLNVWDSPSICGHFGEWFEPKASTEKEQPSGE